MGEAVGIDCAGVEGGGEGSESDDELVAVTPIWRGDEPRNEDSNDPKRSRLAMAESLKL